MIEKVLLSSENWTLRQLTRREFFSKGKMDYLFMDEREVFPAKIPGNVRLDLLNAGKIPDPFYGKNNEKCKWVSNAHWMYERKFEIPISFAEKDLFLKFKRTDYVARFFLNRKELGYNIGMFSPSIFKIDDYLDKNAEEQELTVFLKGSPIHRSWAVKCQMAYGWDFAPNIKTIGIWDDVELLSVDGGIITDLFIHYTIQSMKGNLARKIKLIIELELDIFDEISSIEAEIELPELDIVKVFTENVQQGTNHLILTIPIDEVELWFPNAAGEQKLYEFNLTVMNSKKSTIIDKTDKTSIGFRTIKMMYNPKTPKGNEKWTFVINNRPEFIRGANWVPPDSFFGRINDELYANLIQMAKDVNINMFRMWGGGILEKQGFYESCDENGIMIWQEFPFACSNYPNDPAFLRLVKKECSTYVKEIRNHPSVVAYVGGNEWNPRFNSHLVNALKECCEIDPTRIFYDVSPCKGDLHDWAVWHILQDFGGYKVGHRKNVNLYQFFSEFGLQSCPDISTFEKMMPKRKRFPFSDHWKYHNAEKFKLERYGKCVCALKDLKSYIHGTQVAQAEGLKVGIEHVRKMKPEMSGVLFWQWNEPWPTICWSVIDHYGTPKEAYHYLKQIYNPILPIIDYQIDKKGKNIIFDVYATNDLHQDHEDSEIKIDLYLKGDLIKTYIKRFDLLKESSIKINKEPIKWSIDTEFSIPTKAALNLRAVIRDGKGTILSKNEYYPFKYRENLNTRRLHEIVAWFAKAFNEKFFWIYEINKYLGLGGI